MDVAGRNNSVVLKRSQETEAAICLETPHDVSIGFVRHMPRVGVEPQCLPSSKLPHNSCRCEGEVEKGASDAGGESWLGEVHAPAEQEHEVLGAFLAGVAGHVAQPHASAHVARATAILHITEPESRTGRWEGTDVITMSDTCCNWLDKRTTFIWTRCHMQRGS